MLLKAEDEAQSDGESKISGGVGSNFAINDDATAWWLGLNAEIKVLDPLTFAADVIYGQGRTDDKDMKTKGWYAALAASYKFDMLTATLFSTYGTGVDDAKADKQTFLPTLAEGWGVTSYIGGVRAFNTGYDSFFSDAYGPVSDGTGLWTVGLDLNDITFVENLSFGPRPRPTTGRTWRSWSPSAASRRPGPTWRRAR